MFKYFAILFLNTVISISFAQAVECPLGKGETELTFTRVMLNFGRYTRNADFVATVGQEHADAVKEEQLDTALTDLPIARACAEVTIANSILPGKIQDQGADVVKAYSEKISLRMQEFIAMLDSYHAELGLQKSKPVSERNFLKAYESSQLIKSWVGTVHEELTVR